MRLKLLRMSKFALKNCITVIKITTSLKHNIKIRVLNPCSNYDDCVTHSYFVVGIVSVAINVILPKSDCRLGYIADRIAERLNSTLHVGRGTAAVARRQNFPAAIRAGPFWTAP